VEAKRRSEHAKPYRSERAADHAKAAERRQLLASLEGRIDRPVADIEQLKREIAEYEKCITALEKQVRDA
jgi:hypothetical protein